MITIPQLLILAVVQGACELLPISSSAHVIVAEKLMGLDPVTPQMTLLLVMLHTGTMFAVIFFFWDSWKANFFRSPKVFWQSLKLMAVSTGATIAVGLILYALAKKIFLKGASHAEVELLFGNLPLIATSLAAAGGLILWAGYHELPAPKEKNAIDYKSAWLIGMVQGICLPFRGFSRSGATISTGLILGIKKRKVEDFSFALAVILTPLVIVKEAWRFLKVEHAHAHQIGLIGLFLPSIIGMVLSFIAGYLALRWLSNWLEHGRWYLFGIYCIFASLVIFFLHYQGF